MEKAKEALKQAPLAVEALMQNLRCPGEQQVCWKWETEITPEKKKEVKIHWRLFIRTVSYIQMD